MWCDIIPFSKPAAITTADPTNAATSPRRLHQCCSHLALAAITQILNSASSLLLLLTTTPYLTLLLLLTKLMPPLRRVASHQCCSHLALAAITQFRILLTTHFSGNNKTSSLFQYRSFRMGILLSILKFIEGTYLDQEDKFSLQTWVYLYSRRILSVWTNSSLKDKMIYVGDSRMSLQSLFSD